MSKEEAKSEFLEDLRNKVPNREVFAVATKSQMQTVTKQALSEVEQKVENFLKEQDSYDFSIAEIPNDLWFEIVAFLVLTAEREDKPVLKKSGRTIICYGSCSIRSWNDETFLNLDDMKVSDKLSEIRQVLGIEEKKEELFYEISTDVTVEDLIAYAKSNQPDF